MGIEVIDVRFIHENGIKKSVDRILNRIGDTKCYLTFDIDFLDNIVNDKVNSKFNGKFDG